MPTVQTEPQQLLRLELASRYQVAEVWFDPLFLERSMDMLAGRCGTQAG